MGDSRCRAARSSRLPCARYRRTPAGLGELRDRGAAPMPHVPPVIPEEQPDGRTRRRIGVVLAPREGRGAFRVAAVDLVRGEINEIEPRGGDIGDCGFPPASQPTVRYTPGEAWVSVWSGRTRLWRLLVRRPAGSSGTNGSGIELRYVDYRGKRVLWQAHVPILNVSYDGDACGPYLDWQNEESPFQATGSDPVPGFRLCSAPATSILESGSDGGNFTGVAVFVDGPEVVLLSEMQAGWYRYISSWRLHVNGTIRPRFGFTAVQFPCVCNRHYHHCYWRFDFDIRTPGGNVAAEFNDPPLVPGWGNWHDKLYEIPRPRDYARNRKWRVSDSTTGASYEIVPGAGDGVASSMPDWPFPQGDVWIVRYKSGAEIDNHVIATGPPYEANIGNFVNGESISNQDVVVWYAAHFTHEVTAHTGHIVGPDLVPVSW
jgi:Copper amine oxidase, enzyme domain